jgi:serine/threonine protein kinase
MDDSRNCLSENELLAWVGGELPAERAHELEAHLDVCDECLALVGEALRDSPSGERVARRDETFQPNEVLADRYHVIRFLARGGMGEVYEVHDSWLKHAVALKTLVASISDDPRALARLKAEVLVARRVSHPNVCRIFDLGFHDRRSNPSSSGSERVAFLTMELLHGETLKARVERTGPLTTTEARPLVLQLLAGLGHAHAMGVVHRDFKSDNVMLVESDGGTRIVITDFGLARDVLRDTAHAPLTSSTHGAMGTLDYMAPEQLAGSPATRESDVYALGVVLFEMVTGRLPFSGGSPLARAMARAKTAAPQASKFAPHVGREWEALIRRCMELRPQDRFVRVEDIALHLEDASQRRRGLPLRGPFGALLLAISALGAWYAGRWFPRASTNDVSASPAVPPAAVFTAPPATASAIRTVPSASATDAPAMPAAKPELPRVAAPSLRRTAPVRAEPPTPKAAASAEAADGLLDPFGTN